MTDLTVLMQPLDVVAVNESLAKKVVDLLFKEVPGCGPFRIVAVPGVPENTAVLMIEGTIVACIESIGGADD